MYPTRIIARGFKRGSFDVTLSRANVITGDNFAGKTQILDAVRLALIGYLPELGKLPSATFGLASGKEMEVQLHFDNGDVIAREFWLEGNSVKQKHEIPESLKDCNLLTVMLNAEAYFALGPLDRTRYVFANCPVDLVTNENVMERVAKVAPDYDMGAILDKVGEAIETAAARNDTVTPQEAMELTLKLVAENWSRLGDTAKMHQGTINGITTQRAEEEAGLPVATLQDMKAAKTREVAEIMERRARFLGSFTQMKTDGERRKVIDREIQHGAKARARLVVLKDTQALLTTEIAKLVPVTREMQTTAAVRCSDLRNIIATFTKGLQAATSQIAKDEAELASLCSKTCCPYCAAAGEGWKEKKTRELQASINSLWLAAKEIEGKSETAKNDLVKADMHEKNLGGEQARQTEVTNRQRLGAVEIAELEPQLARYKALEEEKARLMTDDPDLTAKVETIQSELNVANEELRGLDREIEKAAGRAHDLQRMATAEKERDAALKLKDLAAAAGKELRLVQAEMVEGAFRPLLQNANAIFAGVLPFAIEYKDGEIGAREGGIWRGHKTMSGVEKALTYCAIQMALASRAPVKVAVLDEMTKLVSKRVPAFAERVLQSIEDGLVDQVLIIDPERGQLYTKTYTQDLAFNVIAVE